MESVSPLSPASPPPRVRDSSEETSPAPERCAADHSDSCSSSCSFSPVSSSCVTSSPLGASASPSAFDRPFSPPLPRPPAVLRAPLPRTSSPPSGSPLVAPLFAFHPHPNPPSPFSACSPPRQPSSLPVPAVSSSPPSSPLAQTWAPSASPPPQPLSPSLSPFSPGFSSHPDGAPSAPPPPPPPLPEFEDVKPSPAAPPSDAGAPTALKEKSSPPLSPPENPSASLSSSPHFASSLVSSAALVPAESPEPPSGASSLPASAAENASQSSCVASAAQSASAPPFPSPFLSSESRSSPPPAAPPSAAVPASGAEPSADSAAYPPTAARPSRPASTSSVSTKSPLRPFYPPWSAILSSSRPLSPAFGTGTGAHAPLATLHGGASPRPSPSPGSQGHPGVGSSELPSPSSSAGASCLAQQSPALPAAFSPASALPPLGSVSLVAPEPSAGAAQASLSASSSQGASSPSPAFSRPSSPEPAPPEQDGLKQLSGDRCAGDVKATIPETYQETPDEARGEHPEKAGAEGETAPHKVRAETETDATHERAENAERRDEGIPEEEADSRQDGDDLLQNRDCNLRRRAQGPSLQGEAEESPPAEEATCGQREATEQRNVRAEEGSRQGDASTTDSTAAKGAKADMGDARSLTCTSIPSFQAPVRESKEGIENEPHEHSSQTPDSQEDDASMRQEDDRRDACSDNGEAQNEARGDGGGAEAKSAAGGASDDACRRRGGDAELDVGPVKVGQLRAASEDGDQRGGGKKETTNQAKGDLEGCPGSSRSHKEGGSTPDEPEASLQESGNGEEEKAEKCQEGRDQSEETDEQFPSSSQEAFVRPKKPLAGAPHRHKEREKPEDITPDQRDQGASAEEAEGTQDADKTRTHPEARPAERGFTDNSSVDVAPLPPTLSPSHPILCACASTPRPRSSFSSLRLPLSRSSRSSRPLAVPPSSALAPPAPACVLAAPVTCPAVLAASAAVAEQERIAEKQRQEKIKEQLAQKAREAAQKEAARLLRIAAERCAGSESVPLPGTPAAEAAATARRLLTASRRQGLGAQGDGEGPTGEAAGAANGSRAQEKRFGEASGHGISSASSEATPDTGHVGARPPAASAAACAREAREDASARAERGKRGRAKTLPFAPHGDLEGGLSLRRCRERIEELARQIANLEYERDCVRSIKEIYAEAHQIQIRQLQEMRRQRAKTQELLHELLRRRSGFSEPIKDYELIYQGRISRGAAEEGRKKRALLSSGSSASHTRKASLSQLAGALESSPVACLPAASSSASSVSSPSSQLVPPVALSLPAGSALRLCRHSVSCSSFRTHLPRLGQSVCVSAGAADTAASQAPHLAHARGAAAHDGRSLGDGERRAAPEARGFLSSKSAEFHADGKLQRLGDLLGLEGGGVAPAGHSDASEEATRDSGLERNESHGDHGDSEKKRLPGRAWPFRAHAFHSSSSTLSSSSKEPGDDDRRQTNGRAREGSAGQEEGDDEEETLALNILAVALTPETRQKQIEHLAAIKIQSVFRGYFWRTFMRRMKLVAVTAGRTEKRMNDAATVLQRKIRGMFARRVFFAEVFKGMLPHEGRGGLCPYRNAVADFYEAKRQQRRHSWMRAHRRRKAEEALERQREAFFAASPASAPRQKPQPPLSASSPPSGAAASSAGLRTRPASSFVPSSSTQAPRRASSPISLAESLPRSRRAAPERQQSDRSPSPYWLEADEEGDAPDAPTEKRTRSEDVKRLQKTPEPLDATALLDRERSNSVLTIRKCRQLFGSSLPLDQGGRVPQHRFMAKPLPSASSPSAEDSHGGDDDTAEETDKRGGAPERRLDSLVSRDATMRSPPTEDEDYAAWLCTQRDRKKARKKKETSHDVCDLASAETHSQPPGASRPIAKQQCEGREARRSSSSAAPDSRAISPVFAATPGRAPSGSPSASPSRRQPRLPRGKNFALAKTRFPSACAAALTPSDAAGASAPPRKRCVSLDRPPETEAEKHLQALVWLLKSVMLEAEREAARRDREDREAHAAAGVAVEREKNQKNPEEDSDASPISAPVSAAPRALALAPETSREGSEGHAAREQQAVDAGGQEGKEDSSDRGKNRRVFLVCPLSPERPAAEEGCRPPRRERSGTEAPAGEADQPDREGAAGDTQEARRAALREKRSQELQAFCTMRGLAACSHEHHHPCIPFLESFATLCNGAVKLQRWLRSVFHRRRCRAQLAEMWRRRQFEKLLEATKRVLLQWMQYPMLTSQDEAAMRTNKRRAERLKELSDKQSRAALNPGKGGPPAKPLKLPRVETRRLLIRLPFTFRAHSFSTRSEVEKHQRQLHNSLKHLAVLRKQQQQKSQWKTLWTKWRYEHDCQALSPREPSREVADPASPAPGAEAERRSKDADCAGASGLAFSSSFLPGAASYTAAFSPGLCLPLLSPAASPRSRALPASPFLPSDARASERPPAAKALRFFFGLQLAPAEQETGGEGPREQGSSSQASSPRPADRDAAPSLPPGGGRSRAEGRADEFYSRRSISASSSRKQIREHWLGLGGEDISAKVDEVEFFRHVLPLRRHRAAPPASYSPWLHLTLGLKHPNFHRYGPPPPIHIPGFAPPAVRAALLNEARLVNSGATQVADPSAGKGLSASSAAAPPPVPPADTLGASPPVQPAKHPVEASSPSRETCPPPYSLQERPPPTALRHAPGVLQPLARLLPSGGKMTPREGKTARLLHLGDSREFRQVLKQLTKKPASSGSLSSPSSSASALKQELAPPSRPSNLSPASASANIRQAGACECRPRKGSEEEQEKQDRRKRGSKNSVRHEDTSRQLSGGEPGRAGAAEKSRASLSDGPFQPPAGAASAGSSSVSRPSAPSHPPLPSLASLLPPLKKPAVPTREAAIGRTPQSLSPSSSRASLPSALAESGNTAGSYRSDGGTGGATADSGRPQAGLQSSTEEDRLPTLWERGSCARSSGQDSPESSPHTRQSLPSSSPCSFLPSPLDSASGSPRGSREVWSASRPAPRLSSATLSKPASFSNAPPSAPAPSPPPAASPAGAGSSATAPKASLARRVTVSGRGGNPATRAHPSERLKRTPRGSRALSLASSREKRERLSSLKDSRSEGRASRSRSETVGLQGARDAGERPSVARGTRAGSSALRLFTKPLLAAAQPDSPRNEPAMHAKPRQTQGASGEPRGSGGGPSAASGEARRPSEPACRSVGAAAGDDWRASHRVSVVGRHGSILAGPGAATSLARSEQFLQKLFAADSCHAQRLRQRGSKLLQMSALPRECVLCGAGHCEEHCPLGAMFLAAGRGDAAESEGEDEETDGSRCEEQRAATRKSTKMLQQVDAWNLIGTDPFGGSSVAHAAHHAADLLDLDESDLSFRLPSSPSSARLSSSSLFGSGLISPSSSLPTLPPQERNPFLPGSRPSLALRRPEGKSPREAGEASPPSFTKRRGGERASEAARGSLGGRHAGREEANVEAESDRTSEESEGDNCRLQDLARGPHCSFGRGASQEGRAAGCADRRAENCEEATNMYCRMSRILAAMEANANSGREAEGGRQGGLRAYRDDDSEDPEEEEIEARCLSALLTAFVTFSVEINS
ncbi:hypothetical protein BESB_015340 [Besnoitia besnoiti]|uniref:4Fe-4S ferredoxin-type domain-containing protein n=1 Tax=Besnoitia besnoiti TaxID=94643 RepID=A0A2A9M9D0_BESBE|nr:hypothetical protein BESB_015340 [Besnoitia besnoiti]PFH32921.1 hypothetical protein BESB_015340 [Besnoitia besnoiti]